MTAPTRKRRGPGTESRPASTPPSDTTQSSNDFLLDVELVGGINADLWSMLFDGKFKLAVPCDVCGRYLTSSRSKAAGRGPSCAARAVKR